MNPIQRAAAQADRIIEANAQLEALSRPVPLPPRLTEREAANQARIDRYELEQDNADGADVGPPGWEP